MLKKQGVKIMNMNKVLTLTATSIAISQTNLIRCEQKKEPSIVTPIQFQQSDIVMQTKINKYKIQFSELSLTNPTIYQIIKKLKNNEVVFITMDENKQPIQYFETLLKLMEESQELIMKKDTNEEKGKPIHTIKLETLTNMQKEWSRNGLSPVYSHNEDSYDPYGVDIFALFFLKNDINLPVYLASAKDCIQLILNSHQNLRLQLLFNQKIKEEKKEIAFFLNQLSYEEKLKIMSQVQFKHQSGYNVTNHQSTISPFLYRNSQNQLSVNWNCNEHRTQVTDNSELGEKLKEILQFTINFISIETPINLRETNKIILFPNHLYFHGRSDINDEELKELQNGAERILVRSKLKWRHDIKK